LQLNVLGNFGSTKNQGEDNYNSFQLIQKDSNFSQDLERNSEIFIPVCECNLHTVAKTNQMSSLIVENKLILSLQERNREFKEKNEALQLKVNTLINEIDLERKYNSGLSAKCFQIKKDANQYYKQFRELERVNKVLSANQELVQEQLIEELFSESIVAEKLELLVKVENLTQELERAKASPKEAQNEISNIKDFYISEMEFMQQDHAKELEDSQKIIDFYKNELAVNLLDVTYLKSENNELKQSSENMVAEKNVAIDRLKILNQEDLENTVKTLKKVHEEELNTKDKVLKRVLEKASESEVEFKRLRESYEAKIIEKDKIISDMETLFGQNVFNLVEIFNESNSKMKNAIVQFSKKNG
jgi:hypothetical protein